MHKLLCWFLLVAAILAVAVGGPALARKNAARTDAGAPVVESVYPDSDLEGRRIVDGLYTSAGPAVVDGVVYAVSPSGVLTASDSDGVELWSVRTGLTSATPTVVDGIAYVGGNANVFAVDAVDGSVLWATEVGGDVYGTAAVADGVVFVGSKDWNLYALDATSGDIVWSFETNHFVYGEPVVEAGVVYATSMDRTVFALDASTGDLLWRVDVGGTVYAGVAVDGDVVFAATLDANDPALPATVVALDASTGNRLWTTQVPGSVSAAPVVDGSHLIVATHDHHLVGLNVVDGTVGWTYESFDAFVGRPTVADGVVYAPNREGSVAAVDASTGELVWRTRVDAALTSTVAVDADHVYVATRAGYLHVLDRHDGTSLTIATLGV